MCASDKPLENTETNGNLDLLVRKVTLYTRPKPPPDGTVQTTAVEKTTQTFNNRSLEPTCVFSHPHVASAVSSLSLSLSLFVVCVPESNHPAGELC